MTNCYHCNKPIDDGAKRVVVNVASLIGDEPAESASTDHMDCYIDWGTRQVAEAGKTMIEIEAALRNAGFTVER